MPPAERRTLLLLLALAVAGQGVRHFATKPGDPPGQVQLLATLTPGSPRAQRDSAVRLSRPLAPEEKVDVDRASAAEIARLPRVGVRLAKAIVADREAHGAFGSLATLDRVAGIGPGLLKMLEPHLAFSGTPAPKPGSAVAAAQLDLNVASAEELNALPGVGPSKAAAILQYRERHGRFASVEDLGRVPGFGPAALERLRALVTAR